MHPTKNLPQQETPVACIPPPLLLLLTLPTHPSSSSQIRLPPRNLRSLDGTQLLGPSLRRLDLLHRAQLVRGVARDADVVVAFEDELQIADLEGGGGAQLGELAGGGDDLIDEVVGDLEEGL